ncbi:MAG: toll/interleukin-1 receptor domain-containing protein [Chloroflexota bacterium]
MSHVFISYAHKDRAICERVVEWFHDNDNQRRPMSVWYDKEIEGGNNWRDEIAESLDTSFAVAVLLTNTSVKSLYCTYEWSYALGQGIPVIPMLFEDLNITDIPAPLQARQIVDCIQAVPDTLFHQFYDVQSTPPQVQAVNDAIHEIVYSIHRQLFILHWFGDHGFPENFDSTRYMLEELARDSLLAKSKLSTIILERKPALNGRQYRYCWKLVDYLRDVSNIDFTHMNYEYRLPAYILDRFDEDWLAAFEYFDKDEFWRRYIKRYFRTDSDNKPVFNRKEEIFAEVLRAFPDSSAVEVEYLIESRLKIIAHDENESNGEEK